MRHNSKLQADIETLRKAVDELRTKGADILSGRVHCDFQPEIHLFCEPPDVPTDRVYIKSECAGYTHRAMQYQGCELVWITPIPMPGQPRQFSPINDARTFHHG